MADGVNEGSAAMRGSLDAIKGVDAGPEAAERLFLGTSKHDGSPEPTAHLPNTVHAGCRSRESDAGTGDIVENRWISVTDRLPEEGVEVLVWLGDEMATAKHIGEGYWFVPKVRVSAKSPDPTHWMPLPAPPTDANTQDQRRRGGDDE